MVSAENICLETPGRSPISSSEMLQARNHWAATWKTSLLLFSATHGPRSAATAAPACRVQAVPRTSLCHFDLGSLITIKKRLTLTLEQSRGSRRGPWWEPGEVGGSSSPGGLLAEDDLWRRLPFPPPHLRNQPHT